MGAALAAPPPSPPLPAAVKEAFSLTGRVTLGRAKSTFALSEGDLAAMPYVSAQNPHYRGAAPMRLYLAKDLQTQCLIKYGTKAGLAAKLERNASAAAKRRATIAAKPPSSRRRSRSEWEEGTEEESDLLRGRSATATVVM